jgi:hypothetical protein
MLKTIHHIAVLAAVGLATPAAAQAYHPDVMARCAQTVGQTKFDGMPAERNHDVTMRACMAHGRTIPGSGEERPAALRGPRAHR